ncbi:MAG: Na+/H+ antiporter subunit E [Acidimicrobiia bacterium]
MTAVGVALAFVGTLVSVLAARGISRFPSALARMHASSKSASLGLALISIGSGFLAESWGMVGIGALIASFLFVTAPTSGHMLGRAAFAAGQTGVLVHDDLSGVDAPPMELQPPTHRNFSMLRWLVVVVVWMLIWRDVSPGTLVGGSLIGLLIESARRRSDKAVRMDPVGMARFLANYGWMVLTSNAKVAWQVMRPSNDLIKEAIVAYRMSTDSLPVSLLVANAVTFTPGTLSLELTDEPRTLYVHVLQFTTAEEVRASIARLEHLVLRALPGDGR